MTDTLFNPWMMPSDEGSANWNTTFLVSHCGYFTFNFFNLAYILLVEGFVLRRLPRNRLLLIGMFAPIFQLMSCCTSVHRYNVSDEYGPYARAGTILSLIAAIPLNGVFLYLIFPRRTRVIRWGWAFWTVSAVALAIAGDVNFEKTKFTYIRAYMGAYGIYQLGALLVGHQHLKRGRIGIDPSILSKAEVLRLFKLLFLIDLGALIVAATRLQFPVNPAIGSTFMVMVVAMTFVGRMDFMIGEDAYDGPASGTKDASDSEEPEGPSGTDLDRSRDVEGGTDAPFFVQARRPSGTVLHNGGRRVSFVSQGYSSGGYSSDDSLVGDVEAPALTRHSSQGTPEQMVKDLKSVVENLTDQWSQLKEATEKASKGGSEALGSAPPVGEVTSKGSESTTTLDISIHDTTTTSELKGEESALKPSTQKSMSEVTVEGTGESASEKAPSVKRTKTKKSAEGKRMQRKESVDPPDKEQEIAIASGARLYDGDRPAAPGEDQGIAVASLVRLYNGDRPAAPGKGQGIAIASGVRLYDGDLPAPYEPINNKSTVPLRSGVGGLHLPYATPDG